MLHQRHGIAGAGLVLALALAVVAAGGATAQDGASRTLTIYKAECWPGYEGDASANECDANPVPGIPFRVGRPFTDVFSEYIPTDAEGLVAFGFDGLPLDGTLRVIEQLPAGTEYFVAYCVDAAGAPLRIDYPDDVGNPDLGVADVTVGETGDVRCDWYNVPGADPAADRGAPAPTLPPAPVATQTTANATVEALQTLVAEQAATIAALETRVAEQAATDARPTPVAAGTGKVRLSGEPRWWIVPFAPGWGNTEEGHLYFGALVENPTTATIRVGVSFRAYEADGTPFPGCNAPLGEGPGVATTIAPRETALLTCTRTIVPRTLDGLQVTARLWDVMPLRSPPAAFEVMETDFAPVPELSSPMETTYEASALVRAAGSDDTEVALLFRFYDEQGVQVGTCESASAAVEPEVKQRITCSFPLILDSGSPQPIRVQAESLPGRE